MRAIPLERARRIALGAQGFGTPRPGGRVDVRHFRRVLDRNAVVQLDSVNVAARAHYLPFFSRLGPYDSDRLDDWLWRSRENFEHWGHMASVMPVAVHPSMRFRMDREPGAWSRRLLAERPDFVDEVLAFVAEHGPITVSDLEEPRAGGSWWGWSDGRLALHWLYMSGQLAIDQRDRQFTLHFDLPERVLPAAVLEAPTPDLGDQLRELVRLGAKAAGVGTTADIADHFRLRLGEARPAIASLVASGELQEVRVEGWSKPAYLHRDAGTPRSIRARALLSPFDPVVWFRDRAERLFDFHYRIEIYTPKEKRVHGYYVLPFLLGDRIAARVDLKSDRQAGVLRVQGAFVEPGSDPVHVARELAVELADFAALQGLGDIAVRAHGDLAGDLTRAVSA